MILYKDKITGDEMFSDAFPIKLIGEVAYEVDCALVTFKPGQVDIGANPSAEEAEDGIEDGTTTVNNLVFSSRLQRTTFINKKSYTTYLKGYLKEIKKSLRPADYTEGDPDSEEMAAFETRANEYAKIILHKDKFTKWEFYIGENLNPEGMVALLDYREDDVTPYFVFWKDGLKEENL